MGKEHGRQAFLHRRLGRARNDSVLHQHAAERTMRLEVDVPVVDARPHAVGELLLHRVHGADQVEELPPIRRISAGDVAGITRVLRAGVDEE